MLIQLNERLYVARNSITELEVNTTQCHIVIRCGEYGKHVVQPAMREDLLRLRDTLLAEINK